MPLFLYPNILLLLLLLPLMAGLWILSYILRRRTERTFSEVILLKRLKPEASGKRRIWRGVLLILSFALTVIALSGPYYPKQDALPDKNKGYELMFCLDISNSMLCRDVAPDRLALSKKILNGLMSQMKGNRIGLVVFAGNAYTRIPITTDIAMARELLTGIDPSIISNQGTAIGKAIDNASGAFSDNPSVGKAIIVLTDGENHENEKEDAVRAAAEAQKKDIQVSIVGIGSPQGGPIPLGDGNYLTDEQGKTVITKFDESLCSEIAKAGGGIFVSGTNARAIERTLKNQVDKLPKVGINVGAGTNRREIYAYFVWVALILLLSEVFIAERKSRFFRKFKLFDR